MNRKLDIALTGNRFSGKNFVALQFNKIGVPVFNADIVLKFILNYRTLQDSNIDGKKVPTINDSICTNGFLDPKKVIGDIGFDKVLDLVEFELFSTYEKFKQRVSGSYVVFLSSLIFERGYESKFDYTINVFSPKDLRTYRARVETNSNYTDINNMMRNEISEYTKNGKSSFTIHSYENSPKKVIDQVKEIDQKIINDLMKKYNEDNLHKVTF